MDSLAFALRQAARAALPKSAFLRRDRGEALFVSDAPRRAPMAEWAPELEQAGFLWEEADGLARLIPGSGWLSALEARFPEPPDPLCASLQRFSGLEVDSESLALFALGARLMDGEADDGRFDRKLRQLAAECLRLNATTETPPRGGGLYACALIRHLLKEACT